MTCSRYDKFWLVEKLQEQFWNGTWQTRVKEVHKRYAGCPRASDVLLMLSSAVVTSVSLVVPLAGGSHQTGVPEPIKPTDGSIMKARDELSEAREGKSQKLIGCHLAEGWDM